MKEKLIEERGGKSFFECVCAMCHSIFVVRWYARMRNKPLFFPIAWIQELTPA